MKLLFNFILSVTIFIYGMQLFSNSFNNMEDKLKNILKKYTNKDSKSIITGTIITAIIGSSGIITSLTVGLVNSNILTFHTSIGIMMGSNLGTCITSFLTSLFSLNNSYSYIFNFNTYTPIILFIGIILYFKNNKYHNILIGIGFFILGLTMMQNNLDFLMNYNFFKNIINCFNSPILGIIIGIISTSLIQSSSATIFILQTISSKKVLTYYMSIPIILGENIGSCITTLISSIKTSKSAKLVAYSHLLYNVIGTIIFIIIFYLSKLFSLNYLNLQVNSFSIAIIHTLFNLLSIFIFYPFIKQFEKVINYFFK